MRDAGFVPSELVRIPIDALVVLVGPSGSGKSTWAEQSFRPDQVVSTDALRGLVGTSPHDQQAGSDAFDVLALVLERRLKRGLLTVVDSLGLDEGKRAEWIALAHTYKRPAIAVAMQGDAKTFRARNKARTHSVPSKVLTTQLKNWEAALPHLAEEFDNVIELVEPTRPIVVPAPLTAVAPASRRQKERPVPLSFGLHIPRFDWPGDTTDIGPNLIRIAQDAEAAGFDAVWVTDHMLQIPQVGRAWDPMLESYTTLGFLAAATTTIGLGTMVSGITYRNVGHLAKTIATLDALSAGRARCGIGAAWFEKEHKAYGWEFPANADRFDLLEEALQVLPLMWGPGSPSFEGKHLQIAEATCYPRPVQDPLPILVGGSGERRTLELVARYADACNLFGEPDVVRHKVAVLHQHCDANGRDPSDITVTQLSNVLVAAGPGDLTRRVAALRTGRATPEDVVNGTTAGLVDDHIGRFRLLQEAGVHNVVVSLHDLALDGAIANFAKVIDAFK